MYRMNVEQWCRWKLLTEACSFFCYLCDVSARVNEPQQIARKDIIMSAHASSPCFKTKAVFFTPVKEKWHRQLLSWMSSYRFYSVFLSDTLSLYHYHIAVMWKAKTYWFFIFFFVNKWCWNSCLDFDHMCSYAASFQVLALKRQN